MLTPITISHISRFGNRPFQEQTIRSLVKRVLNASPARFALPESSTLNTISNSRRSTNESAFGVDAGRILSASGRSRPGQLCKGSQKLVEWEEQLADTPEDPLIIKL